MSKNYRALGVSFLAGVIWACAILLVTGCQAGHAGTGLRVADAAAHIGGFAADYPDAHEALHDRIDDLESMDPEADLGWEEWVAILGSVGAGLFGLNSVRDRKYKRPPGSVA